MIFFAIIQPLRSCYKIFQVSAEQGKNRRESIVYMGLIEQLEPIFNAIDVPAEWF